MVLTLHRSVVAVNRNQMQIVDLAGAAFIHGQNFIDRGIRAAAGDRSRDGWCGRVGVGLDQRRVIDGRDVNRHRTLVAQIALRAGVRGGCACAHLVARGRRRKVIANLVLELNVGAVGVGQGFAAVVGVAQSRALSFFAAVVEQAL